jgi:penicillin amidase
MLSALIALTLQSGLTRGDYGVPIIRAANIAEAMELQGYATAQDRLWQMEMSRRGARSRLAEVLGAGALNSDIEQAKQFYTDAELRAQLVRLPASMQGWFKAYAKGVNRFIQEGSLPAEYDKNGFKPEPWTEVDSAAITIKLLQTFGRGGAGELRNLALYKFLEAQSKIKDRATEVFGDFAWQNDPNSVPTCPPEDDLVKTKPSFPAPSPEITKAHLAALPPLGVFELLPGVRVVSLEETKRQSEVLKTPFKSGSYCVVVGKKKSTTGGALLLSGPQMGFTVPSIIHEVSLHAPDLDVAGMAVPGVPGVMVGATPNAAWGLTTGVADTEDIYLLNLKDKENWAEGAIRNVAFTIPVKGAESKTVERRDTDFGQIVFEVGAKKVGFARKRAYEGRELQSYEAVVGLWQVKDRKGFDKSVARATMNFNCFIALKNGDIGWRYLGDVPRRPSGFDPRFPLPPVRRAEWDGFIPFEQMPNAWNPKRGYLANWNNKPAAWWPNLDTPAWGEAFRNRLLLSQLEAKKLSPDSLQNAVVGMATMAETYPAFASMFKGTILEKWNGSYRDDPKLGLVYSRFTSTLREELFLGVTGNLGSPDNFALVAQPDVMLRALRRETSYDYLLGRTAAQVVSTALDRAVALAGDNVFVPATLPVPAEIKPVPWRNRGTYIQIVEVGKMGMNVVTPGVSTSGSHSSDQTDLARLFGFKPMVIK